VEHHEFRLTRLSSRHGCAQNSRAIGFAQRALPDLGSELDAGLDDARLPHEATTIRRTGCPNGGARPYIAEIGFVGRAPGKSKLYLGGGFAGQRLSKLYAPSVKSTDVKTVLTPIIQDYAKNREDGERFGDFTIRAGYVKATEHGHDFHKDLIEPGLAL
jgi:sulfite reductase (NADPH) hemoprotein beta-component